MSFARYFLVLSEKSLWTEAYFMTGLYILALNVMGSAVFLFLGGAVFLASLIDGNPLGEAAETALEVTQEFDLAANIAGMISAGAFIKVATAVETREMLDEYRYWLIVRREEPFGQRDSVKMWHEFDEAMRIICRRSALMRGGARSERRDSVRAADGGRATRVA